MPKDTPQTNYAIEMDTLVVRGVICVPLHQLVNMFEDMAAVELVEDRKHVFETLAKGFKQGGNEVAHSSN